MSGYYTEWLNAGLAALEVVAILFLIVAVFLGARQIIDFVRHHDRRMG